MRRNIFSDNSSQVSIFVYTESFLDEEPSFLYFNNARKLDGIQIYYMPVLDNQNRQLPIVTGAYRSWCQEGRTLLQQNSRSIPESLMRIIQQILIERIMITTNQQRKRFCRMNHSPICMTMQFALINGAKLIGILDLLSRFQNAKKFCDYSLL